ncbi:MAG: hypothetical protein ABJC62_13075 [Frankiaceae bacterium]
MLQLALAAINEEDAGQPGAQMRCGVDDDVCQLVRTRQLRPSK